MKKFILLLMMAAHAQAGWFGPSKEEQEIKQYQQELKEQRHETGNWQIIAGAMAIGAVVLFTVCGALRAKVQREVRHH